jgi:hypothetical protein
MAFWHVMPCTLVDRYQLFEATRCLSLQGRSQRRLSFLCPELSTTPWRRMKKRYSYTILDLGTRWRWVVNFTPRPLQRQGKSPRDPLFRRLCGPQSRSGRCGVENNLLPLPGIEPRPTTARIPSLYRLSYPGSLSLQCRIINLLMVRKLNHQMSWFGPGISEVLEQT